MSGFILQQEELDNLIKPQNHKELERRVYNKYNSKPNSGNKKPSKRHKESHC
jgi:hypothetical protein